MKLRVGQLVAVEFMDHVEDGSEPMACTVYGRVAKVHKDFVTVDCWCYTNIETEYDSNVKRYTILRSTVVTMKELKEIG